MNTIVKFIKRFENNNFLLRDNHLTYYLGDSNVAEIPVGVQTVGPLAFVGDINLKTVYIPSSVREIDNFGFAYCESIENFIVSPENQYFSSLNGVLFSKDGKKLVKYPMGKRGKAYSIPSGVCDICEYAFEKNKNLTEIKFPYTMEDVRYLAFVDASDLRKIYAPFGLDLIFIHYSHFCEVIRI